MLRTTHVYHGFRDHIDCTKFVKCTIWFVGHISELGANVLVNSTQYKWFSRHNFGDILYHWFRDHALEPGANVPG